ncbi:male-enhanced antigen 1 [Latimeria chalumnae]|uniref:Male-enhanced antigen 1 n=1 Tax=Latimeria chalumnae TaxID=7897 RepID=H3A873_LATCH|nr:PREDICTED: male-enhanced antigen 1 [Latimeria chalumnae]XP_014351783.1 PREDICTED: male-enhanced antigen 1 [Latimeria chalumnae]XP_014351784.1 PREDICTED: male-enhanced antigen 1 [Latimeria chalumnae]|eukprot:XP_006008837.1 PREDICTED: male-enhanced antigen 1 [Latimeria chalumnae]
MEVEILGEREQKMGPERIFPNADEDLPQDRPPEGPQEPVEDWSSEEEEDGGVVEEEDEGGYYYQPVNQDTGLETWQYSQLEQPEDVESSAAQVLDVQERIQAMGLYLPEPPIDSDEEEEGALAQSSERSIPMDPDHVELVKRTMAGIKLPSLGIPPWAREITDDQWKDMVQRTIRSREMSLMEKK